jgi:Ca2+-binding EF-hand superfamily protein
MKEIYENDDAIANDKGKIATMKKAFKSYDKDNNGVLDRREVVDLLTNHFKEQGIKRRPTKADVDQFFDTLDEDHSGVIDFEEFKHFLIDNMRKKLLAPLEEYLKSKGVSF